MGATGRFLPPSTLNPAAASREETRNTHQQQSHEISAQSGHSVALLLGSAQGADPRGSIPLASQQTGIQAHMDSGGSLNAGKPHF